MEFPQELVKNNRLNIEFSDEKGDSFLYMRVPPPHIDDHGAWIYANLRSDQSFNWSLFSMPHWVRFNGDRIYLKDNRVIAFQVLYLMNASKLDPSFESDSWTLKHDSDEFNYSHSVAILKKGLTKLVKGKLKVELANKLTMVLKENMEYDTQEIENFYSSLMEIST